MLSICMLVTLEGNSFRTASAVMSSFFLLPSFLPRIKSTGRLKAWAARLWSGVLFRGRCTIVYALSRFLLNPVSYLRPVSWVRTHPEAVPGSRLRLALTLASLHPLLHICTEPLGGCPCGNSEITFPPSPSEFRFLLCTPSNTLPCCSHASRAGDRCILQSPF